MIYYLAFDTETTGLSEKCNVLTAYFIIYDKDFNEIDNLDLYIKYENYHIEPRAMQINKINLEEHEKIAIYPEEATEKITNFIKQNCDTIEPVEFIPMGQNVSYDLKMTRSNFLFSKQVEDVLSNDILDTLLLAKKLKIKGVIPPTQSLSLGKLCSFLGIEPECEKLHTAEYDIRLTVQLYHKLMNL